MPIETIDIAFRGATTAFFLVLATQFWLSRIALAAQIAMTCLAIASSCRIWGSLPTGAAAPSDLLLTIRIIGAGGAFAMTWLMITIFIDDLRAGWIWLASGAIVSLGVMLTLPYRDTFNVPVRTIAALHFAGLVVMIVQSGKGDLLDARRRLRPALAAFLGIYCVGLALTAEPMRGAATPERALMQSAIACLCLFLFTLWVLKVNMNRWAGQVSRPSTYRVEARIQHGEQTRLIQKITDAMSDGIWRMEGLTVAGLAQKVDAPEHQIRKAINQELGHRNFASFINRARIEAAKSRLADPDAGKETVLEIAYDVGFSSLGPFNRAFRDVTGQTPTEFRKRALA